MLSDLSTAVMTSTFPMTLPMITREYRVGSKYMAKSGTAWLSMMSCANTRNLLNKILFSKTRRLDMNEIEYPAFKWLMCYKDFLQGSGSNSQFIIKLCSWTVYKWDSTKVSSCILLFGTKPVNLLCCLEFFHCSYGAIIVKTQIQ